MKAGLEGPAFAKPQLRQLAVRAYAQMAIAIVTHECIAARVIAAIAVHAPAHIAAANGRVIGARRTVAVTIAITVIAIVGATVVAATEERQAEPHMNAGAIVMMVPVIPMMPVAAMTPIVPLGGQLEISVRTRRIRGHRGDAASGHHIGCLSTAEAQKADR